MRIELCDKCGKEMKQFDWSPVRFPYIKIEKVHNMITKTTYDLCYDCQQKLDQWLLKKAADVQPVKHGRWIEIEPMLRLIEHIQMMLTTIYDTGGCIQSGDMKCLIETSDRLKELVKESGCYMREEGESDG